MEKRSPGSPSQSLTVAKVILCNSQYLFIKDNMASGWFSELLRIGAPMGYVSLYEALKL